MDYEVRTQTATTLLEILLREGESVMAEPGAMVTHTPGLEIETQSSGGGLMSSLKNSVLGGESLFQTEFTATRDGVQLTLGTATVGDIVGIELSGETLNVQSGSYVAAGPAIEMESRGSGSSFFGGEGLFVLELSGSGPAFVEAFGGIETVTLDADQSFVVDTGHLVAWEPSLTFDTRLVASGIKSSLLSGEGRVCDFTGPGTVYIQTTDTASFADAIQPHISTGSS
jgi:uncharacterized protein (TIGR00266 family)